MKCLLSHVAKLQITDQNQILSLLKCHPESNYFPFFILCVVLTTLRVYIHI